MSKTEREMFDELIMAVPFTHKEARYIPKIKVALEKQIPKKPILDTIFPSGVKWFRCPVCNHNGIEKSGCYCHSCGQALLWESEE